RAEGHALKTDDADASAAHSATGDASLDDALAYAARYARDRRAKSQPLDAVEDAEALRRRFKMPLPEKGCGGADAIEALIAAAEPGLVANTSPQFFAWVMGASDATGVAADWLTAAWGQNAAIYQTSPAAAIAEEAVGDWLLELLDLPRGGSVGFVTGATMAGFVGLAAARTEVLARAGHDFEADGLQGAPAIRVFLSEDAHVSNFGALRFLGLGEANFVRVACDDQGLMETRALRAALERVDGPKIVIGQAGHINSGGFEDFEALADYADAHNAWLHVDGAFGLWARVLPEKAELTAGVELADSWSVDGHKWLQLPYDSGFIVVRNAAAHRRAMTLSAGYLSQDPRDGRNPTEFNPELSRRARGFAAWAVLRAHGRAGVVEMVRRHCAAAEALAARLSLVSGVEICNEVRLNQVAARVLRSDEATSDVAAALNREGRHFVRTALWRGRVVLRFSVISRDTDNAAIAQLTDDLARLVRARSE
ncbi:MAG: pyridoxal-dependent decarboxylase, partial [Pseudomonadota bacterium]